MADTTASYADLTSRTLDVFVDACASASERALAYSKALWQVAARPSGVAALAAAVKDGYERGDALVELSVAEMQASARQSAEFVERLTAQAARLQESYVASVRGLVDTTLSNMTFVSGSHASPGADAEPVRHAPAANVATMSSN